MSTATTSADVELAISEFNVGRQQNWEHVHNELQQHYAQSQTSSYQSGPQIVSNQHVMPITPTKVGFDYDPRGDWPDNA
jgi:hypothetical protein